MTDSNSSNINSGSLEYNPEGFSLQIFKDRYAFTENETWFEACRRVSRVVAACENNGKKQEWEEKFYKEISSNRFTPGGRVWYGAGRPKSNLVNCFVLSTSDSREGWGKTCSDVLIVSGMGGGIGASYSKIRPRGTPIAGTGGFASGAVSFMKIINAIAEEIKSGGGRRSAHMQLLDLCHGDIEEFLDAKIKKNQLNNANISVSFGCISPEDFFGLVEKDKEISLMWRGTEIRKIKAKKLWNKIIDNAYENGEPGLFNHSFANKMNNTYYYKEISGVNPCGEVTLPEAGSCVLGSIVLHRFVNEDSKKIDWDKLDYTVRVATRFLDNVISVTSYPLQEIEQESINSRRIGLGVTGFHDMLLKLGIKYDSKEALETAEKVFSFICNKSYETSTYIAVEKGVFPVFDREQIMKSGFIKTLKSSTRMRIKEYGLRNSSLLSCPPTGTVSIISGNCSSGIEPIFGPCHIRRYYDKKDGDKMKEEIIFHPLFDKYMTKGEDVSFFECVNDISLRSHFEMQRTCQRHIDQAISKTIIVDKNKVSKKEIEKLIIEFLPELKGLTIYPLNSRSEQPITPIDLKTAKKMWLEKEKRDIGSGEQSQTRCKSGICDV
jgi:ribonucleoside-diphosphate reductase alpha chain